MQSLVKLFGNAKVRFSQKATGDANGSPYTGPISSFSQALPLSTHHKSIYCLDEDMTYNNKHILASLGEVMLGPEGNQSPMTRVNGFRWLPPELRFGDRALLLGGASRSTGRTLDANPMWRCMIV